jgi:HD superfamily phosphohydrolase
MMYYFQIWQEEVDPILSDLCKRFVNRNLFKFAEFDPAKEYKKLAELTSLFEKAGLDPEYYLVVDSSSDLPYDFYRPGEEEERLPINLLLNNGELRELSRESEIVEAISGKRRTDHKLYYPADFLMDDSSKENIKKHIRELLDI